MSNSKDWLAWYEEMTHCVKNKDGYHNFIPHSFSKSEYTEQATSLVCSHCLQIVRMDEVYEFNAIANS